MPIILERRHRLLHMLASLETKCCQPKASSNIHWTFSQFQTTWLRRDDLMATDMEKLHNKKNTIKPTIWKRDASRRVTKGMHDRFFIDSEFRVSQLEHDRDEEVCIKMDELADKDFSHYMTKSEYFRYRIGGSLSIRSGNTGPLRNRSDFNVALSTFNRLHQECGAQQLRPMSFWKYRQWHQSSSSSSSWWQWSDSWWSSQ